MTFCIRNEGTGFPSTSNPWFYLWILASVVSSCYAYTWDIKMDWGLMDTNPGDNKFLREEIVYSSVCIKHIDFKFNFPNIYICV